MRKLLYLWISLVIVASGGAWAQPPADCVSLTGTVRGPADATLVRVTDLDGRTVADLEFTVREARWSPDQQVIERIKRALSTRGDERLSFRLNWFQGAERIQTDRFILPGEEQQRICPAPQPPPTIESGPARRPDNGMPQVGNNANAQDSDVFDLCREEFRKWNEEINTRLGHERYLAILFGPDGQIVDENKDYGVAGDLIYTAICDDKGFRGIPQARFTKCDLQSAIPKNPEGDARVQLMDARVELRKYPVRQCFGTSAEIKVVGTRTLGGNIDVTHTIGLYERYRYTLQVAALETDQHVHAFGLRKDGEQNRIYDKGPIDDGPEYVASVVLYAFPRYIGRVFRRTRQGNLQGLEAIASRTYHGRDVINDHALADRIGLVFGAGVDNPRDRFVTGLSFELIPGVNLLGVYERAKLKELVGVEEDDVFTGTAEQIPTRDVWDGKVVFGVSLDLRYVAGLFRRGS